MSARTQFLNATDATARLFESAEHFVLIPAQGKRWPPYEICPMAAPATRLHDGFEAALMDMDGTISTTEPLVLEALDAMVAALIGDDPRWEGIDRARYYAELVGHSNAYVVTRLLDTYRDNYDARATATAFFKAVAWTMKNVDDAPRRATVHSVMQLIGVSSVFDDADWKGLVDEPDSNKRAEALAARYVQHFAWNPQRLVRVGSEIYSAHYLKLLLAASRGELTGAGNVSPMPGVGVFMALLAGVLGEDAAACAGVLVATTDAAKGQLKVLGRYFEENPVRLAVVTSSTAFEANLVLNAVFRTLHDACSEWGMGAQRCKKIEALFESPESTFETIVTATGVPEMRLKPYRDLYSLTLDRLEIPRERLHRVAGFEDSAAGCTAIRTAGIPLAVAVPSEVTEGQTFEAATVICERGLPQVIFEHNCFLP